MSARDDTYERRDGPTPNGGAYSIAHWSDAQGRPVPRGLARYVEVVEYDAEGGQVFRTYGKVRQPLPRVVAEQPGEAVIVMTGGSTPEDAVGRILDLRTLELGRRCSSTRSSSSATGKTRRSRRRLPRQRATSGWPLAFLVRV